MRLAFRRPTRFPSCGTLLSPMALQTAMMTLSRTMVTLRRTMTTLRRTMMTLTFTVLAIVFVATACTRRNLLYGVGAT